MMTLRFLFVVVLALCFAPDTQGFLPTRKKNTERRSTFGNGDSGEEDVQPSATSMQTQYQTSPTAAFSVPPAAMVAAFHEYQFEEEEEEVPYELALISCIVSLAIGFGTGYLV